MSKTEIEVTVKDFALTEVIFHRFKKGNHMTFHILCASAVDISVIGQLPREGRVLPSVNRGRHNVNMTEITSAFQGRIFAFKVIDDAVIRNDSALRLLVEKGICLFKPVAVVYEGPYVVHVVLNHRHCGDADCLTKVLDRLVLVNLDRGSKFHRGVFWFVESGADDESGEKQHYHTCNDDGDNFSGCHNFLLRFVDFIIYHIEKFSRVTFSVFVGGVQC